MPTEINAEFEVTNWDEQPFDDRTDGSKMSTATVTKSYSGDISGDSVTEWLMAYEEGGSASFVGLERIVGSVSGRSGTMVLRHVGSYEDGAATAKLTVLGGSGTDALAGVDGTGDFIADPAGKVKLALTFPA